MAYAEIAAAVGGLALDYIKSQSLQKTLENHRDAIANMIDQGFAEMRRFVKFELADNLIREAEADVRTAVELLEEWDRSRRREEDEFRILNALVGSRTAMNRLRAIGWYAFEPTANACGVLMLSAVAFAHHKRGENEQVRILVEKLVDNLRTVKKSGEAHLQQYVDGVTPINYTDIVEFTEERGGPRVLSLKDLNKVPLISVTTGWSVKAYYHDNGREENVIDKFGRTLELAKSVAFNELSPRRDGHLNAHINNRDNWSVFAEDGISRREGAWRDAYAGL